MNQLYQMMQMGNPMTGLIQRFNQFRQQFQGNPQQQIQQLLNSGRVSQQQYDQAVQMARQLQQIIGVR